jgi:chromosome segregation ATPase
VEGKQVQGAEFSKNEQQAIDIVTALSRLKNELEKQKDLHKKIDDNYKRLDKVSAGLSETADGLKKLVVGIKDQEGRIAELKTDFDSLAGKFEELKVSHIKQFGELEGRIKTDFDSLAGKFEELKVSHIKQFGELEGRIKTETGKVTSVMNQLEEKVKGILLGLLFIGFGLIALLLKEFF